MYKAITYCKTMGNTSGAPLFGTPRACNNCSAEDRRNRTFRVTWHIVYDNEEVENFSKQNGLMSKVLRADGETLGERIGNMSISSATLFGDIDFARAMLAKIEHITGYVSVSSSGNIRMEQFLCDGCHSKLNLYDLPDEWGFEVFQKPTGYYRIDLP